MKQNRRTRSRKAVLVTTLVLLALGGCIAALVAGYGRLRAMWLEQGRIVDMERQVTIQSGKMVLPDVIAEIFGLRRGVVLGEIDFAKKRADALARIPNIREITISRYLPDRVTLVVEERKPIARMNFRGCKSVTGRVVDEEGVVFDCIPGTSMLPTIREPRKPGTPRGQRLERRARAALTLVELCREPEYQSLGLLEVDISKQDFLVATLGNYSTVKLAWEGMDESTVEARRRLRQRLTCLVQAIASKRTEGTVTWDVSDLANPNHIYAK